jgi:hypothetical protein
MPQAVPFIVAAGKAIGRALLTSAVRAATQLIVQKLFSKRTNGRPRPLNVTVSSTVAERTIAYGTIRVGGSFAFVRCSGTKNKYLWFVIIWSGRQCTTLKDLWLDKFKIAAADINGTTGAVSTSAMDGKLKCWDKLGTQAQTADANLTGDFASIWLSTHRLRGCCYSVIRLERSDKAFPNGAPSSATRLLDGAKVYDSRLDTTNGGSGSHRRDDPQTWAFSRNPFLILRDYLTGGSVVNDQATRLVRYGPQESDSRISDAYFAAAANIADQSVSGANAPPSGAEVRYTCDIEVGCGETRKSIIEDILMTGGPAQLSMLHGKWRVYAGAYDAPAHSFNFDETDDVVGDIEIDDTSAEGERFNQVSAVFIDSTKEYTEQTTPVRSDAAYVTQDGGEEIFREIPLRGVTRQYQAQRITERILRDSRQMRGVTFRFDRRGMPIAPWETFSITCARLGWTAREFRCIDRKVNRGDGGAPVVVIRSKASAASVDTDLLTADYTTGTSVTNSLQRDELDDPTGLTAQSLPRAIEFNWSLGEFWERNASVEIWEHTASTPFSSATRIWTGTGTRAVIPKDDFTTRYYWVRLVTKGGQVSATEPASTGLAAVALPAIDIVSDPQFALATDEKYWWRYNPSGGSAATITLTGGTLGGYASIPAAGLTTPVYLINRRPLPYQCARGEIYTITVRARITGSLSGVLKANVLRHARAYSQSTFSPTPASGLAGEALGGLQISAASIGSNWTEFVGLAMVRDVSGIAGPDLPRLSAIVGTIVATSGSVDVDLVSVQPGQNCAPQNKEYTASSDLSTSTSEYFKNLQYNSTSPGTITLPFAETEHVGARIYFEQVNTGLLTIAVQGGESLQSSPNTTGSRALAGRYARAYAEVVDATTWRLVGDL